MELWTIEHVKTLIPSLIFMIVASVILRRLLKDKSHSVRMIPFQILACVIFLIEIGKQAVSLHRGYDLYHLPFHFCSLFIFMLPLAAFYKGKYRQTVYSITAALCSAVFLLMLIYPDLIYSANDIVNYFEDYMCFHTVTFHNVVMLEFLLMIFLDLHEPSSSGELKGIIIFTVCFNVVAAIMSQLLKTNYNNLYRCNIPPLESLRQAVQNALGEIPAVIIYVCVVILLNVLFVSMSYGVYRLFSSALHKKSITKKHTKKYSTV